MTQSRSDSTSSRDDDERWMRLALELAEQAARAGEVPVGAVIVRQGEVLGTGTNAPISTADPTAHAEIQALRAAARTINNYRLTGCEMFVTVEPCAMCAGALVHARLERLVFAALEPRSGAVCSSLQLLDRTEINHQVRWEQGPAGAEAGTLMREFFRNRRQSGGQAFHG